MYDVHVKRFYKYAFPQQAHRMINQFTLEGATIEKAIEKTKIDSKEKKYQFRSRMFETFMVLRGINPGMGKRGGVYMDQNLPKVSSFHLRDKFLNLSPIYSLETALNVLHLSSTNSSLGASKRKMLQLTRILYSSKVKTKLIVRRKSLIKCTLSHHPKQRLFIILRL